MVKDGEPWFVGKDVAEALGYKAPKNAITQHVDGDDRIFMNAGTQHCFGAEFNHKAIGQRGGWIINESGLYSLIMSSKLPTAKKFKRWITAEVLPSVRKHGAYIIQASLCLLGLLAFVTFPFLDPMLWSITVYDE